MELDQRLPELQLQSICSLIGSGNSWAEPEFNMADME